MEIPLKFKYRSASKSRYKSSTSNNNPKRHKGETDKNRLAFAKEQTRKNKKVLLVLASGRKKFVKESSLAT